MVELPNYLGNFDDNILVFGVSGILMGLHQASGLSFKQGAGLIGITERNYKQHLLVKNRSSIKFLKKFSEKVDKKVFDEIFSKNQIIVSALKKQVFLPKVADEKLAYFAGYLYGDGCLTSDKKSLIFSDEYLEQIFKMGNLSKELFGVSGHVLFKESPISLKPTPCLEIKSKVMNSFFYFVFGLNRGEKKNLKIPHFVKKDKELLKHFLAGLFDADGTIPKDAFNSKQLFIDITFKEKRFIEEIRSCLLLYGVETLKIFERYSKNLGGNPSYELRIRRKEMLLKFLQEIGFYHPNKSIRAKKMVELLGR